MPVTLREESRVSNDSCDHQQSDQSLRLQIHRSDGIHFTLLLPAAIGPVKSVSVIPDPFTECDDASPALDIPAADLSEKVERVLVDTGTRYDLVAAKIAKFFPESIVRANPVRLSTASGVASSSRRALVTVYPKLGGVHSLSRILKSTPTVLSVCARVLSNKAAFAWVPEHRPLFMFPDGLVAILTVHKDCPYLDDDSIQTTMDDPVVRELCGVSRLEDGSVVLHVAFPVTGPAAPAVGEASDGETSGQHTPRQVDPPVPESDRDRALITSTPDDASLFGPSTPRSIQSTDRIDEALPDYELIRSSDRHALHRSLSAPCDLHVSFVGSGGDVIHSETFHMSRKYRTLP